MAKVLFRYLKEKKEIQLLKTTDIIQCFKEQLITIGCFSETFVYYHHKMKEMHEHFYDIDYDEEYDLHDFYNFFYEIDDGQPMKEIAFLLTSFLKSKNAYKDFVKELELQNEQIKQGYYVHGFSVVIFDEKDPIYCYVKSRYDTSPIEMIRKSFSWINADNKNISWANLNNDYETYIKTILRKSSTT